MKIKTIFLLALFLTQCSILKTKKHIEDPLVDFYSDEVSTATRASLNLTEKGRDFIRKKEYDLATEFLNKALSLDPYQPFSYFFLGLLYYQKGEYQSSSDFLLKAAQFSQKFPFWRAKVFALLYLNAKSLNQTKSAEFYLKKALSIDPAVDPEIDFVISD